MRRMYTDFQDYENSFRNAREYGNCACLLSQLLISIIEKNYGLNIKNIYQQIIYL